MCVRSSVLPRTTPSTLLPPRYPLHPPPLPSSRVRLHLSVVQSTEVTGRARACERGSGGGGGGGGGGEVQLADTVICSLTVTACHKRHNRHFNHCNETFFNTILKIFPIVQENRRIFWREKTVL